MPPATSNLPGAPDNMPNNHNDGAGNHIFALFMNSVEATLNKLTGTAGLLLPGGQWSMDDHKAAADPHTIYLTPAEANAAYSALGHTHTQVQSHNSPDTDVATTSLHHTIGTSATQAAAGNHSHGTGSFLRSANFSSPSNGEVITGFRIMSAFTATTVWGYISSGTSATVQILKNGVAMLSVALPISSTANWFSHAVDVGGSLAAGDTLTFQVVTQVGNPAEVLVGLT